MLLLVEDFWEVNWPVHLATEVVSEDRIVLNTVLFAKFSLYQIIQFGSICCYIQCPRSYYMFCLFSYEDSIKIKDKFRAVTKSWGWQLL